MEISSIYDKKLTILTDGTSFDLDPIVKEPFIYNTSEGVQIQRYSPEVCGVRVKNVAQSISGNWTLISENDRKDVDQGSFMLEVLGESQLLLPDFLYGRFKSILFS